MWVTRCLVVLMLICFAGLTQAASDVAALQTFYDKVQSLSANFKQVERDGQGNIVQQSSGLFLLSRPDRFRWVYEKPYKQTIVSDGKEFKFYDEDLAQVTIRNVDAGLKVTPALLLTGGKNLTEAFDISSGGQENGLDWVTLTPKSDNASFKSIDLGLKDGVPRLMRLHDNLGQATTITFSHIKLNPDLPAGRFTLNIPDNVEVVDGRPGHGGNNR